MIKLLEKYGYFPRVAVWELTLRCNLSCLHCGSRAGKPRDDELNLAEALQLCEDLAALKCRHMTLGGGEPLLRADWPIITEKLVDLGVTVGMVTNGMLWSAQTAHTARTVGLESVAFSVDGFEVAHDHLRHSKGLWRKVLNAIDVSKAAGMNVSVVTTVYERNKDDLEALRKLLDEHGVDRWQIQLGTTTGNFSDHRDLALQPEQLLDLVPRIAAMCRDGRKPKVYVGHDVGYYGEPEERLRDPNDPIPVWTGCPAGCSIIGIESNGNIKGCLSLPSARNGEDLFVEGNLRQKSLEEIWKAEDAFAYNRKFTTEQLSGFCRTCDYAEICRGGCTWTKFSQDKMLKDNEHCYFRQLTLKQRAEADSKHVHLPVS
ncbi:MAG: radical SAM protein [Polyangiaceae bacterium]